MSSEEAKLLEFPAEMAKRAIEQNPRFQGRDAEFEAAWRAFQQRRRTRWIRLAVTIFFVLLAVIVLVNWDATRLGAREAWFRAVAAVDDDELAGVDLQRVHSDLLPAWLIARSNESDPGGSARAEVAYNTLLHAVAPSPGLSRVIHLTHDATAEPGRMFEHADRLIGLINDWNAVMSRHGRRWWIDGNVLKGGNAVLFYVKSYSVAAELRAFVGQQPIDARIVARVDRLNVVENVLGHASPGDHAAVVLVDRLHDFALERVWPVLGGELENVAMSARTLAPLVRQEVSAALSRETFDVLATTAAHRLRLLEVQRSIHERQHCGNSLAIRAVPWNGLGRTDIRQLSSLAASSHGDSCPTVTPTEFAAISVASAALRENDRLENAVANLVAWLARSITVHEVRHMADQVADRGLELPLPCTPCDDSLSMRARAELSAWLAELAWSDSGYTTLLHACTLDVHPRSATGAALNRILDDLGDPCEAPPRAIAIRARQLESAIFGRSQRIALPANFPVTLSIGR